MRALRKCFEQREMPRADGLQETALWPLCPLRLEVVRREPDWRIMLSAHFISKLITAARCTQLHSSSHNFWDYQDLKASANRINWLSILFLWVAFQIRSFKVWNSYATCLNFCGWAVCRVCIWSHIPIIINTWRETWNLLHWWEDVLKAWYCDSQWVQKADFDAVNWRENHKEGSCNDNW